ncbi:hypothetical protein M8J76_002088 [Diaphorina citri]|nr:hypothetical protein M8J76_002088 [Diaphorina citri]
MKGHFHIRLAGGNIRPFSAPVDRLCNAGQRHSRELGQAAGSCNLASCFYNITHADTNQYLPARSTLQYSTKGTFLLMLARVNEIIGVGLNMRAFRVFSAR